jgi:WD40 repeat protein
MALAKEKTIIATGSFENEISISNYESANVLLTLTVGKEGNSIENIAFLAQDKFVAFAGTDKNLQILDLNTQNIRLKVNLGEESISIMQPSNKYEYLLYMGTTNGYFYVYDIRGNGEYTQTERVHKDIIMDFIITPDEKFAITGSLDKTINLVKMIDIN